MDRTGGVRPIYDIKLILPKSDVPQPAMADNCVMEHISLGLVYLTAMLGILVSCIDRARV